MRYYIDFIRNNSLIWEELNPLLPNLQVGVESDTGYIKIGDGKTSWRGLPYSLNSIANLGKNKEIIDFSKGHTFHYSISDDDMKVTLPLDGLYYAFIDWGDGTPIELVKDITGPTHYYTRTGNHTIKVVGDLDEVYSHHNSDYLESSFNIPLSHTDKYIWINPYL